VIEPVLLGQYPQQAITVAPARDRRADSAACGRAARYRLRSAQSSVTSCALPVTPGSVIDYFVAVGPDNLPKVLEKLATSDKSTLVIEKQPDGKMRVLSGSWEGETTLVKSSTSRVSITRMAHHSQRVDLRE
jgi:hypothetical protein